MANAAWTRKDMSREEILTKFGVPRAVVGKHVKNKVETTPVRIKTAAKKVAKKAVNKVVKTKSL